MPKIDFILNKFPLGVYDVENPNSNIVKVLGALAQEFDIFLGKLDEVKKSRFIDFAKTSDLEALGDIFNLPRIFGESDLQYRGRIKARVPSFIGGGTISAIQQVVQQFLGVTPMIIEHYNPGDGHVTFDNGVLNGLLVTTTSGLGISISSGYSYINGTRITSPTTTLTLSGYTTNRTDYVYMKNDGTFYSTTNANPGVNEIPVAQIAVTSATLAQSNITDKRVFLDPFAHHITNIATITVQIPYNFVQSLITVQDVKDILKKTKAAGVALLIQVVQVFTETITLTEVVDLNFLIGFSGVGSQNLIDARTTFTTWEILKNPWSTYTSSWGSL